MAETITALATLLTAGAVFLTAWRTGRHVQAAADSLAVETKKQSDTLIEKTALVEEKVDGVHTIVNSQRTELLKEIAILKDRLGLPADLDPTDPDLTAAAPG